MLLPAPLRELPDAIFGSDSPETQALATFSCGELRSNHSENSIDNGHRWELYESGVDPG